MHKYKEIIAFCIFFSLSFVFMSKVVKTVDPVVSTFITYGLAAIVFFFINIRSKSFLIDTLKNNRTLILKINFSTLTNTLLAFFVVLFISPLAYIIVFFSGLSFINVIYNRKTTKKTEIIVNIFSVLLAISIAILVSDMDLYKNIIGLTLTLTSTLFGAFYMRESAKLHQESGISASQILSIRFFMVIIFCGLYSIFSITTYGISLNDITLLFLISITGSIIPLFLMQISIQKLGAKTTSQFTPLTPILCLFFMAMIDNQKISMLEILLTLLMALVMLCQSIVKKKRT